MIAECRLLVDTGRVSGEEGNEAIDAIKESKLPKLLEQVKVIFPADTYAHRDAKWTLEQLE